MTTMIKHETFEAGAEQPAHGYWVDGTVEVTIRKETRRVKAMLRGEQVTAFGLTGRYQTGSKAWPAQITRVVDPRTNRPWDRVEFGRDERAGRCKKTNMVFFKD